MVIKGTIDDSLILLHNTAQFFGIGSITTVEPRPEGLANLSFLVKTDQGEYILKEVLNRTVAETELEMLYLNHVLAHHIPAPGYLPGLDGRMIFCQENHHVVAQKKVEGQAPDEEKVEWGEWYWYYNLDMLELPKL